MHDVDFTESEFINLSNRSEKAFWFAANGPTHWTVPGWSVASAAANMKRYQKALTRYAKAHHGNGKLDEVQLRALEHIAMTDRTLWRIFAATACRRIGIGEGGDKWWRCASHGIEKGDSKPCTKAYMDWLGKESF